MILLILLKNNKRLSVITFKIVFPTISIYLNYFLLYKYLNLKYKNDFYKYLSSDVLHG